MLSIQLKVASTASHSKEKEQYEDLRFTRTLLLMLHGAMAEIAIAWTAMQPILKSIAPLLVSTVPSHPNASHSTKPQLPSTPGSRQHHILSIASSSSATIRTPISPIPERAESHSPSSSMANSPVFNRSVSATQPFASLATSTSSGSLSGTVVGGSGRMGILAGHGSDDQATRGTSTAASSTGASTPTPTPGPPSQAARSKARRQAGSFSTKDVEIGSKIPPFPPVSSSGSSSDAATASKTTSPSPAPPPALRSALRNPFATTSTTAPAPATSTPHASSHGSTIDYSTSPFTASEASFQPPSLAPISTNALNVGKPSSSSSSFSPSGLSPNGTASSISPFGHPPAQSARSHSTQSSVSSSLGRPASPQDDPPIRHQSGLTDRARHGRYGLSNYGRTNGGVHGGEGGGPETDRAPPALSNGGLGSSGGTGQKDEAASRMVDQGLVDLMVETVEIALSVYAMMEEDLALFMVCLFSLSLVFDLFLSSLVLLFSCFVHGCKKMTT